MKATPEPSVSGKSFLRNEPLVWTKRMLAAAVMSVNVTFGTGTLAALRPFGPSIGTSSGPLVSFLPQPTPNHRKLMAQTAHTPRTSAARDRDSRDAFCMVIVPWSEPLGDPAQPRDEVNRGWVKGPAPRLPARAPDKSRWRARHCRRR